MPEKNLVVGVTLIITALSTGGTTLIPLDTANAVNMNCAGVLTTCNVSNQEDNIILEMINLTLFAAEVVTTGLFCLQELTEHPAMRETTIFIEETATTYS